MASAKFKDHFSAHAEDYAKFRPRYPEELFCYLATVARGKEVAWDCATGNGQAAIALAGWFERVVATDASEEQVANAEAHARVEYRVAQAEESGITSGTADLITSGAGVALVRSQPVLRGSEARVEAGGRRRGLGV